MADPLPPACDPDSDRVAMSYDGRSWHFHHEREVPRTIELIAALMAAEHGDGEAYELPDGNGSFPCTAVVTALVDDEPAAQGIRPPWEGRMAS